MFEAVEFFLKVGISLMVWVAVFTSVILILVKLKIIPNKPRRTSQASRHGRTLQ